MDSDNQRPYTCNLSIALVPRRLRMIRRGVQKPQGLWQTNCASSPIGPPHRHCLSHPPPCSPPQCAPLLPLVCARLWLLPRCWALRCNSAVPPWGSPGAAHGAHTANAHALRLVRRTDTHREHNIHGTLCARGDAVARPLRCITAPSAPSAHCALSSLSPSSYLLF